jgi:hypothetical protein
MVTICAWCERYLGSKEPLSNPAVSHGICTSCIERQELTARPVVVVSRRYAEAAPVLQGLLAGTPEITVVVERRSAQRRRSLDDLALAPPDRRHGDRRAGPAVYLA